MKIFTNKNVIHKIVPVLIILLLFNFIVPNCSRADDGGLGGALLEPILDLLVAIGDGVMWLIQNAIFSMSESLIHVDFAGTWWQWAIVIGAAILAAVVAAVLVIATAGAAGAILAALGSTATISLGFGTVAGVTIGSAVVTGLVVGKAVLPDDFYLPIYRISPYEIFSNSIPTFDVNFFNPADDLIISEQKVEGEEIYINMTGDELVNSVTAELAGNLQLVGSGTGNAGSYSNLEAKTTGGTYAYSTDAGHELPKKADGKIDWDRLITVFTNLESACNKLTDLGKEYAKNSHSYEGSDGTIITYKDNIDTVLNGPATGSLPGKSLVELAQYYKNNESASGMSTKDLQESFLMVYIEDYQVGNVTKILYDCANKNKQGTLVPEVKVKSTAGQLQNVVSGWYYALRNVSMIGLLSVLVYVGIRIVISSTANEKAKYKSMIMDWIIAMCLLFFLHYIMAFSVTIVEKITEALNSLNQDYYVSLIEDKDNKIRDAMKETDSMLYQFKDAYRDENGNAKDPNASDANNGKLEWKTNEIGFARIQYQLKETTKDDGTTKGNTMMSRIAYMIIFLVLIVYTLIFSFTYLKRVLYMAFLTLIAPLVALTYPIDKLNDGKAQAFDTWLKEYIFNLLIQPMHLVLYTVLIGTAFEFASTNMLYTIVALGFMTPAEKLMRRFFGFEKAQTPGAFGGAAGAALMMTGMQNLLKKPPHGKDEKDSEGKSKDNETKPKFAPDFDPDKVLAGDDGNGSDTTDNSFIRQVNPPQNMDNNRNEADDNNIDSTQVTPPPRMVSRNNNGQDPDNGTQVTPPVRMATTNPQNEGDNESSHETVTTPRYSNSNSSEGQNRNDSSSQNVNFNTNRPTTPANKRIITPPKNTNKKTGSIKDGFKNMGHTYWRNIKSSAARGISKAHPVRTLRKATTAALGGAAIGTLGLAMGIASGDPSKALQYTAAGAFAGGKFTMGAGDKVAGIGNNITNVDSEAFKEGYYGDDYAADKYIKNKQKDIETDEYLYKQGMSKDERKYFKQEYLPKYVKQYGLTETEDMYTAYEMEKQGFSRDEAVASVKMANTWGDISSSPDLEKKWKDKYTDRISNYDSTKEEAEQLAKQELKQNEELQRMQKQYEEAEKKAKEEEKKMKDLARPPKDVRESVAAKEAREKKHEEQQKKYKAQQEAYERYKKQYESKHKTEYDQAYDKYRKNIAKNTTSDIVDKVKAVNELKKYHK